MWIVVAMISVIVIGSLVLSCPVNGQIRPVPDPRFTKAAVQCPPKGITIDGQIVRVIDGDTVVVRSHVEYHVRLLDCWAPESRTSNAKEKTRGLRSKARMQQLATDKPVRVHLPGQSDLTDMVTLGRVLGRIWVLEDNEPAPQDLSSIMVAEKLATPTKPEN